MAPMPITGIPIVDAILQVIGAIYAVATVVGNLLPHDSPLGQKLRRFAADLKQGPPPPPPAKS